MVINKMTYAYLCLLITSLPEKEANSIGLTDDGFVYCLTMKNRKRAIILATQQAEVLRDKKLTDFKYFVFPFEVAKTHAVLGIIDTKNHKILIYDSQQPSNYDNEINGIKEFMLSQGVKENYTVEIVKVPQQENNYDCAIFVMEFARKLLFKQKIDNSIKNNIDNIRKRIKEELTTKKLKNLNLS